eukprot:m.379228 g.379228  ORF g.379228 m.379228 type:complete len:362 (+) comp20949_c1_seq7:247-1332(+)
MDFLLLSPDAEEGEDEESSGISWDTSSFRFARHTPCTPGSSARKNGAYTRESVDLANFLMEGMPSQSHDSASVARNTRSHDTDRPLLTLTNCIGSVRQRRKAGRDIQTVEERENTGAGRTMPGSLDSTPLRRSKRIRRSTDRVNSLQALEEIRELLQQRTTPTSARNSAEQRRGGRTSSSRTSSTSPTETPRGKGADATTKPMLARLDPIADGAAERAVVPHGCAGLVSSAGAPPVGNAACGAPRRSPRKHPPPAEPRDRNGRQHANPPHPHQRRVVGSTSEPSKAPASASRPHSAPAPRTNSPGSEPASSGDKPGSQQCTAEEIERKHANARMLRNRIMAMRRREASMQRRKQTRNTTGS